jgi:chemotaxis signal transduction protein/ABC-type nitrate/sulfonate/bicarbonate transport system substrate-binding protein/CheY-like chemotaxis protein
MLEERKIKMPLNKEIKILIVEDSQITRKMEIKILKQLGFTKIIEANDGDDAILKLQSQADVSLIISDWNMPNKNGYDLLVWVRSNEKYLHIPFIMATGQSEKKQTQKAKDAGVNHFVSKPFSPDELKNVIQETFAGNTQETSSGIETLIPQKSASNKLLLRAGHIQITDHLILGVLKDKIASGKATPKSFELETRCMATWNQVQKALEKGDVDAACILAPIAMDLFAYGVPLRLVLFAHKNGSISVRDSQDIHGASLKERLKGKTFYLPHILSIHHMLSNMFLKELGLNPGLAGNEGVDVFFEIVPPVKMPEFLAKNPDAGGFMVAEPLGTKAIASGSGNMLYLSGEAWEHHPCCVLVVREEIVKQYPDAVQEFTDLLVESGQFIAEYPEKAAEIAFDFLDPERKLGLNVAVLKNVLKEPQGIKTNDLYPVIEDLDRMQRYMHDQMKIGTIVDLDKFVDTRFAEIACSRFPQTRHSSVLHDIKRIVQKVVDRDLDVDTAKTRLDREGKYLIFSLCAQNYGVRIESVAEVIQTIPLRSIPKAPPYVKGVINLRGNVIPVVDLRLKFGKEESEYNERTCIIILDLPGSKGKRRTGIVVDTVSEVLNIKGSEIEDTPSFGTDADTDFILGMAKVEKSIIILLDVDWMLKEDEEELVELVA